jgi:flagellar motility protein MotE (MotC chaperone)
MMLWKSRRLVLHEHTKAPRPARRLPVRRGGLFFLALFMGLSGLLRIGDGVGLAVAQTSGAQTAIEPAAVEPVACEPDGGAKALLATLRDREQRLIVQEQKSAEKAQTLALARTEIDTKLAELEAAEKKLAQTIALADQASQKDVSKLVAMYETMKPKDAARLFAEMAPDFAAGFLAQMRPDAAAAVLSGLDPNKAYTISVVLAGRNALAPKS